jgi:hypothetical protein
MSVKYFAFAKTSQSLALLRDFPREDVKQQATLEVARADFDVLRHRARVGLAEDNYVRHKDLVLQSESRFWGRCRARCGRRTSECAPRAGRVEPDRRGRQPARRLGTLPARRR